MTDIHKKKTPVTQIGIGMFVTALDRPWLGTPFLLEGLLIEDQEQIDIMVKLCQFVYVDHTASIGEFYIAPEKRDVTIKREAGTVYAGAQAKLTKLAKQSPSQQKFTFFNMIKEIQASNQASQGKVENSDTDNILLNIQNINDQIHTAGADEEYRDNSNNSTDSLTGQLSNLISSLTSWGKKNKPSKIKPNSDADESALEQTTIFSEEPPVEDEIAEIYPAYHQSQVATREIFEAFALNQKIDISHVNEALESMVASIERNADALIWLAKLKKTDNYAYNHALNVSITLMAFANFISLPKIQIKNLGLAGLLQDLGKGKLPQDLLHKTGKLISAEFSILKKHVEYSYDILKATANIPESVIRVVSEHHERFNGQGYPNALIGQQISLGGQMAGLVDTYCAMTTNKVYAKGVYNQIALEKIQKMRDSAFSSSLIDQLVQFLGIYPVTSLVELNSGEVGVVIQQNSVRRMLPRVMILLNPDKSKNEFPATINLINKPLTPSGEPYRIVKGLPSDSYGLDANNYYG